MNSQFTEKLTKLPAVPNRFGDDGGKFYGYYDELADELDEDMVTSLKSQLDGILIFVRGIPYINLAACCPETLPARIGRSLCRCQFRIFSIYAPSDER